MDKQEKRMRSDAHKSATVNKVLKACPQSSEGRSILKKMLKQRDQEISILDIEFRPTEVFMPRFFFPTIFFVTHTHTHTCANAGKTQ